MFYQNVSLKNILFGYLLNFSYKTLERYHNVFINLAIPFVNHSEPIAAEKKKYYDTEFTLWDRFELKGELTLAEFFEHFDRVHKLKITMLSSGVSVLYAFFNPKSKCDERMRMPMSEVVKKVSKKKIEPHVTALVFEIMCNDDTGEDVEVPYVRYTLA